MGEAKRRAATDPNFGKADPQKRGLVVSSPLAMEGSKISGRFTLDPQELRFSLLLWDRLVWPSSGAVHIGSGPDEEFLQREGVLSRPMYTFHGEAAEGMAKTHAQAFKDLDKKEPGAWSLAQGENSLLLRDNLLERDGGVMLELHRAIPVPDKDVPLNEVLEFKRRRKDELQKLRQELDGFVAAVEQADDKGLELRKHVASIDEACADALKTASEWQFPVRLTNMKASVELRPFVSALGGYAAYSAGTTTGLGASAAILAGIGGATIPALKITADFGWKGLNRRLGPYRYVYQFHNELF